MNDLYSVQDGGSDLAAYESVLSCSASDRYVVN